MKDEPISSLMQDNVVVVGMDDTVAQVEQHFVDQRLSWAPVAEPGGAAVGVISSADLLLFHARGGDANAVRAWQLSTYKPITVSASTPIREVARLMTERKIHHVVVADNEGLAGAASAMDFVRWVARDL